MLLKLVDKFTNEDIDFKIFRAGAWLALLIFIITNGVEYILGEEASGIVFWYLFDFMLIAFSVIFRNRSWETRSLFILSIYNAIDEALGFGFKMQWYEFPFALFVIATSYISFNPTIERIYEQKILQFRTWILRHFSKQ